MMNHDLEYDIALLKQQNSKLEKEISQVEYFKFHLTNWAYHLSTGEFTTMDIDREFDIKSKDEKKTRSIAIKSLLLDETIQTSGKRHGHYRLVDSGLKPMDFVNTTGEPFDLWLPFNIHEKVKVFPGNIIQINGEKNSGKALENSTPILTKGGWAPISELKVGDTIFGKEGQIEKVSGVYPQPQKNNCYRFTFNDGSSIDSDADHIWTLQTFYQRYQTQTGRGGINKTYLKWINMTTNEIVKRYGRGDIKTKPPKFPINGPVEMHHKDTLVDPYILGLMLGDGCITSGVPRFSNPEMQIIDTFKKHGYILKKENSSGIDYRIRVRIEKKGFETPTCFRLKTDLKEMGLWGKYSNNKFVPKDYMFNSCENRMKILKGLMDTDGHVSVDGLTIEYSSASKQLAEDVQFLVRSLGGRATISIKLFPKYYYNGEKRVGQTSYRVNIKTNELVFHLEYKKQRQLSHTFKKTNEKVLRRIDYIGKRNTTCIKTTAKDGLFIAKDFIVTHNTAFVLNIVKGNMNKHKVVYFNSEMGAQELNLRLSLDNTLTPSSWNFRAYERSSDFSDVIVPGEGNINIIDFLEIHDEFYKMGEYMRNIHDALKGAIAIVCIQKNKGQEFGLGGGRTEEKPRLILNLMPGKVMIKMAKNWVGMENPNGKQVDFKLVNGIKFIQQNDWYKEIKA